MESDAKPARDPKQLVCDGHTGVGVLMLPNIVLFAGIDSANNAFGLWETDGTAAGTFELTSTGQATVPGTPAINGEALYGFLPDPPWSLDLTVFNGEVLFVGRSAVTS